MMKNNLLALILLCLGIDAHTQTRDSLNAMHQVDSLIQVSRNLIRFKQFDKAFEQNALAEAIALESFGPASAAYGKTCFIQGKIFDEKQDFPAAIQWYQKAISIQELLVGPALLDCAYSYANLGSVLNTIGEYYKSEPLYLKAMKIIADQLGKEHPHYGLMLNNQAQTYKVLKDYDQAEPLFLEAIRIRKATLGDQHQLYANSLKNLANLYLEKGDFPKAAPLYLEAKKIWAIKPGVNSDDYATLLIELASLYQSTGEVIQSEQHYKEGVGIVEKLFGKNSADYAWAIASLGTMYLEFGDYNKAAPLFMEAMAVYEKLSGKDSPVFAEQMMNLGSLQVGIGEYAKGEPLYTNALAILEKSFGQDSPEYIGGLINLATLYFSTGNYTKAEPLFLESKASIARLQGTTNSNYATVINNLGDLYLLMGNYEKAELLFIEASEIFAKVSGEKHVYYAFSQLNLGSVYLAKGDYSRAEAKFLVAKNIYLETVGDQNSNYAITLNNLGELYFTQGLHTQAERYFLEASSIWETLFGKEHPYYATALINLGGLYLQQEKYSKAEALLLEADQLFTRVLGTEHPNFHKLQFTLAALYDKTNQVEKAEKYFLAAELGNQERIITASGYFSEYQMMAYLQTFEPDINQFYSFCSSNSNETRLGALYNSTLFYNGLLFENASRLSRAIAGADSLILDTYEKWQSCHRRLAKRFSRPVLERKKIDIVKAEADKYEKQLMRDLPSFQENISRPKWQEVQARLNPGEVAIEFVQFQYYAPGAVPTERSKYAALLLFPDSKAPEYVPLFEEKTLDSILLTNGRRNDEYVKQIYEQSERGIIVVGKAQKSIYDVVWKPLDHKLSTANKIYFAPTGLLHRVNLSAIPISFDSVLADRYQLVQLRSTRHLAHQLNVDVRNNDLVAFGGVSYDMDSIALVNSIQHSENKAVASRSADESPGYWPYLNWTEKEVRAIADIAQKNGLNPEVRTGFSAHEEAVKACARTLTNREKSSPRVLHLATHGYFSPDPRDRQKYGLKIDQKTAGFIDNDHPLMRSGLLLAGANQTWVTGKPLVKGMENGILTAYEISHLDLTNTELAVLSACETGLGDLQGNEGVYGLQRAFKIAGVKYLITSLWRVPDKQTSILMTKFYENWLGKKMEIPDAFRAAQKSFRESGLSPYNWAGFVLIE